MNCWKRAKCAGPAAVGKICIATNVHRLQDIDTIFAASADLTTGVIVEALPETTPDRVEITWLGVSYNDYWPDEVSPVEAAFETNPLMFKVILRNNG
ncbi:MAG: hypothetical protein HC875_05040, partial [Anaerolineales bacterium]|nr:hypothetical protein [Anaerolineales bacterium]